MDEALVKEAEKYIIGKQEPINKYDLAAFAEAHIEELRQSKKGKVVEHFEAYGQCRDSRRIAELEAQIEKMKWHKVADGDLPKDRHNVYVAYMNGYYQLVYTIASFRHKYWIINGLKTECEIIAWCELPKWEIKEND